MVLKEIHAWTLILFISYLTILITLNVTGPDYASYTSAAELGITNNFFKLREFLSFFIIDNLSRIDSNVEYLGLKIFSSISFILLFLCAYRLIKEQLEKIYSNKTLYLNLKIIMLNLTFFVCATPYVNLLALSALRQSLALIFLVLTILMISRHKFFKAFIAFLLGMLCHNSAIIFLPLFVFVIFKKNNLRFFLIFTASIIYYFLSSYVPYQSNVDADNRIIYFVFSIFCIALFMIKRKSYYEIDLILLASILLTLPFFNIESYYDRLGLYASFFGSILISKKIITTRPIKASLLISLLALVFGVSFVAFITYPPLIS